MKTLKKFFDNYFIYLLIFCFAFSLRVYCIYQKDFFQHDELFSFISSTPANLSPDGVLLKNHWDSYNFEYSKDYKISDIKKSLFESSKSLKSIKKDLSILRNQNIDRQHPTLYYNLFRIWNSGFDGLNPQEAIYRGCSFNLIIFCLSFFFMFKLLNLIKPNDKKFISLGLLFSSLCTAGISDTLLIREYALSELLFVICSYITLLICKKISDNKTLTFKEILGFSLVFSLLAQANYFSIVFDGLLALTLIGFCMFYKNFYLLKKLLLMIFLAFMWIFIIYPDYFCNMFNNEYSVLIINNNSFLNTISVIFKRLTYFIGDFIIYKYLFVFIIFLWVINLFKPLFENNKLSEQETKYLLLFPVLTLLWVIIFLILYPLSYFEYLRFLFPAISLLSLFLVFLSYRFKKNILTLIIILFTFLSLMPVFFGDFQKSKLIYMHYDPERIFLKSEDSVENYINNGVLSKNSFKDFHNKTFKINKNIPVVIFLPEFYYTFDYFVVMDNDGILRFENKIPDKNFKYNKFILYSIPLEKVNTGYKVLQKLHYSPLDNRCIYYVEIK